MRSPLQLRRLSTRALVALPRTSVALGPGRPVLVRAPEGVARRMLQLRTPAHDHHTLQLQLLLLGTVGPLGPQTGRLLEVRHQLPGSRIVALHSDVPPGAHATRQRPPHSLVAHWASPQEPRNRLGHQVARRAHSGDIRRPVVPGPGQLGGQHIGQQQEEWGLDGPGRGIATDHDYLAYAFRMSTRVYMLETHLNILACKLLYLYAA